MVMKTNVRIDFFQSIMKNNRKIKIDNTAVGIDSITTKLSSAQYPSLMIAALNNNEAENILAHPLYFTITSESDKQYNIEKNIIFKQL